MKYAKIISFVAGLTLLAATLVPVKVSAASAPMSLAGATQSNGSFSTVVYETSDGPVSSVSIAMSFSQSVSGISYDYSVGPFTTTDPSGGHLSQGSVTGRQAVARVSFTLAAPGTVTASVNPSSSYVKGASGTTIVNYTISSETASFTYTAPTTGGQGGGSTSTGSTSTTNSAASTPSQSGSAATTNTGTKSTAASNSAAATATDSAVEGDSTTAATDGTDTTKADDTTKNADDTKKADAKDASSKSSKAGWIWLIVVLAVAAGVLVARKLLAPEAAAKAKAPIAGAGAAATALSAKKKEDIKKAAKPIAATGPALAKKTPAQKKASQARKSAKKRK